MKNQQQQGDVCIEKCSIPKSAKPIYGLILAEGEVTGHKHKIIVQGNTTAELLEENKGNLYLRVSNGSVELVHEEHKTQTIEVGEYIIRQVIEYDYETNESIIIKD